MKTHRDDCPDQKYWDVNQGIRFEWLYREWLLCRDDGHFLTAGYAATHCHRCGALLAPPEEGIEKCPEGHEANLTRYSEGIRAGLTAVTCFTAQGRTCWHGPPMLRDAKAIAAWNKVMRAVKQAG